MSTPSIGNSEESAAQQKIASVMSPAKHVTQSHIQITTYRGTGACAGTPPDNNAHRREFHAFHHLWSSMTDTKAMNCLTNKPEQYTVAVNAY